MTAKWNIEYTSPIATGENIRLIGVVNQGDSEERIKRTLDEMSFHATRLRERSEIVAMEEKQAQMEHNIDQLNKQKDALNTQLVEFGGRRAPTNLVNSVKAIEEQIPTLEDNLRLVREMIAERKERTRSVYP